MVQFHVLGEMFDSSGHFTCPSHLHTGVPQGVPGTLIPNCMGSCRGQILIETATHYFHVSKYPAISFIIFEWISETRRPSQIRTDLMDLAYGSNGFVIICNLRTQDISWLCRSHILMDPLSPWARSMRSVRIWLGPRVSDTLFEWSGQLSTGYTDTDPEDMVIDYMMH